jgi:3-hydroxyacyl-CoA dehydrogenase/enoyl-CoA hydratase/3-hydroxybutyryl-CoA epimerase
VSRVFHVEWVDGGAAHLVMDHPDRRVNVLDVAALESLEGALDELIAGIARAPRGVVVRSARPGSFIAGADVEAIGAMTDPAEVRAVVERAHATFQRLASLPVPTVAAIDGVCLGGGTELALACDSRVAAEEPRTQIGLPEILLGIIPGFGGTTRLPRLIGLTAALDLILTGRALDARRAAKTGLVARAVPAAWLLEAAHRRLDELAKRPAAHRRDRWRPASLGARLLDGTPFGRGFVLDRAAAMTRARTGGHYPAPNAALRVLRHGTGRPIPDSLKLEADEVSALVVGPVCKNLVRIFQLSERAKKAPVVPGMDARPEPVRTLALLGTGVMGAGIAELASRNGVSVRMRDLKPEALTRALQTVRALIDERGRRRRASARERDAQMALVYPTLDLDGFGRADLAIEAVVEDLEIKRRVFAELEVRMRPDALLATNTSSLSVDAIAAGLQRPERFCGFHFFNPVHRMPLVEVVRGARTSDEALTRAVGFARALGKTPVVVRDAPGFVVNRLLMPYLREAMFLLEEGYALRDVDGAMRRFGMPMGPFEVLDEVGLDVAQKVAGVLTAAFPDRMSPAPALDRLVAAGRLGRKSGTGFYRHAGGRRTPDPRLAEILGLRRQPRAGNPAMLSERMVLAMVNEGARVLDDDVVDSAEAIDLAMIFGAGFPPFRGGPMRWADSIGLKQVEARIGALRAEKGERFAPAPRLTELARADGSFTGLRAAGSRAD